jgi:tetratricopeptide (TPR) repeat protein
VQINKLGVIKMSEKVKDFFQRAETFRESGNAKQNQYYYQKALRSVPNEAVLLTRKGIKSMQLKEYIKALSYFDQSLSIEPYYYFTYMNKALVYFKTIEDCPDISTEYIDGAKIHFGLLCKKALDIYWGDARIHYNLGLFGENFTEKKDH